MEWRQFPSRCWEAGDIRCRAVEEARRKEVSMVERAFIALEIGGESCALRGETRVGWIFRRVLSANYEWAACG